MLSRRRFSALLASLSGLATLPSRLLGKTVQGDERFAALKGEVIFRGDASYETRRKNLACQKRKTGRRPDVLVRPLDDDDIVTALEIAARHDLKTGVRSGGHSWVHSAIREGGMLLDMHNFRQLHINEHEQSAIAGPGRARRSYSEDSWERIRQVQATYDPQGRFHSLPRAPGRALSFRAVFPALQRSQQAAGRPSTRTRDHPVYLGAG